MTDPVKIRRKNKFNYLKEAERLASFDEFPMLRPDVDPQLHVSYNTVDQPFHLICQKDCVIAQPTGNSRIEFTSGPVRHFDTEPGDYVYIPAGYPHRIRTTQDGILLRYKARDPGGEAVIWVCQSCGEELGRHEINVEVLPVQSGYAEACEAYNANPAARTCPSCGAEHSQIDLSPFRWRAVSDAIVAAARDEPGVET